MTRKIIRRLVIVWCLYGACLVIAKLTPITIRAMQISGLEYSDGVPISVEEPAHIALAWVTTIAFVFVLVLSAIGLNALTKYIFGEK